MNIDYTIQASAKRLKHCLYYGPHIVFALYITLMGLCGKLKTKSICLVFIMCQFLKNGERWSYALADYKKCKPVCKQSNPAISCVLTFLKECEDTAFYEFVFSRNCPCAGCNPVDDQTSDGFVTVTIVVDS